MTASIPEPTRPSAPELLPDSRAEEAEEAAATRVIVVGALKGGTGKSRIAMLIALILAVVFRRRVVVIDADSGSQTSSNWPVKAMRRYADPGLKFRPKWPVEVIRWPFDTVDEKIDEIMARGDVDDVVVDVGGGNVQAFLGAVRRANKLIVPLCPDEGDLEQAPKTREAAFMAAARNTVGGCMMYYILSRCENSRDKQDARKQLLSEDTNGPDGAYPLLDTDIPALKYYRRSFGRIPQMRSVSEDPDCPRWKDLRGFIPMLLETEILTKDEVRAAGLMVQRELDKVTV